MKKIVAGTILVVTGLFVAFLVVLSFVYFWIVWAGIGITLGVIIGATCIQETLKWAYKTVTT